MRVLFVGTHELDTPHTDLSSAGQRLYWSRTDAPAPDPTVGPRPEPADGPPPPTATVEVFPLTLRLHPHKQEAVQTKEEGPERGVGKMTRDSR